MANILPYLTCSVLVEKSPVLIKNFQALSTPKVLESDLLPLEIKQYLTFLAQRPLTA